MDGDGKVLYEWKDVTLIPNHDGTYSQAYTIKADSFSVKLTSPKINIYMGAYNIITGGCSLKNGKLILNISR